MTKPLFESNFTWGITNTQYSWWDGNAQASGNAKGLLESVSSIYNVHIMGWGPGNPWPSKDSAFNFDDIRARVNLALSLGGQPWITFCTAPGWMKNLIYANLTSVQQSAVDWNMNLAPLPQYEDDFAALCAAVAQEFPEVKVFQVWNEFKGMYLSGALDSVRYTRLYNKVYAAVKNVRPDAKIGGFYAVLEGDGTHSLFPGEVPDNPPHTDIPLVDDSKNAISYFLANAAGLDYFLVDRANVDYHNDGYVSGNTNQFRPTRDQAMTLTKYFRKTTADVAEMTDKPIVWSEYYGTYGDDSSEMMPLNSQYIAAHYASIVYNMIMGSGGRYIHALLWVEKEADIRHALFTDTDNAGGGQPTPHYVAMKKLLDNFPKGTMLYTADISADGIAQDAVGDKIEALVSASAVLVINKTNMQIGVIIDGVNHDMDPYAVEVFAVGKSQ